MADLDDRFLRSTFAKYVKGRHDSVTESSPAYYRLKQAGGVEYDKGGTEIQWRARTSKSSYVVGHDVTTEVTFTPEDLDITATLGWRGMAITGLLHEKHIKRNKGTEQIYGLLKEIYKQMTSDLVETWEDHFYGDGTGLSSKTFHGVDAFLKQSTTYAGNTQSSTNNWGAQLVTGTNFTADPKNQLCQIVLACERGGKPGGKEASPTDMFCDRTVWQQIYNDQADRQRWAMNKEMADAGFKSLEFMGIPITKDDSADATTVFCLNMNMLHFWCTTSEMWATETDTSLSPLARKFLIWSDFNMWTDSPRYHGKISSIT